MKTYNFNLQSKGGVGKSMLTYLQALKNESNFAVAFIDLDNSTKTSISQLKFLEESENIPILEAKLKKVTEELNAVKNLPEPNKEKEKELKEQIKSLQNDLDTNKNINRVYEIDVNDEIRRIDREKFFSVLEALNEINNLKEVYIDFGAPESEQFPKLLSIDFTADEFKEFEESLNAKFIFNIIIAGGAMYDSCYNYLKKFIEITKNKFEIKVYANLHFFYNHLSQLDNLRTFTNTHELQLIEFGQFNTQQASGIAIIDNIKAGKGMTGITSFAAKTVIKRTLATI